ncbi:MAG TPA: O-antigen ligase family protein [Methylophilus sp.]
MSIPAQKFKFTFSNGLFFLTVFWIAGFFFFPKGQLHNQAFLAIFLLPALWLMLKIKVPFKPFLASRLFWVTCIFCLYYAISTAWGTHKDMDGVMSEIKRAFYFYAFWLVIFFTYYLQPSRLYVLAKFTTMAGLLSVLVVSALFYGLDHSTIADRLTGFGRLRNPLWVAALYGAMATMMLCVVLQKEQANKLRYFAFFIFFFTATLLTHSRGPIISMAAVCLLIFFASQLSIKLKIQITTVSLVILFALSLIFLAAYQADIERGQSYRLDLWLGFLQFTKHHLILGNGAGTNLYINSPGNFAHGWSHYHNVYLGSLVELGLVGLSLHLLVIALTIRLGWRYRQELAINIALMVFIFSCLIGITYGQGVIERINAQWIIFWLPIAVIIMRELECKQLKRLQA